MNAGLSLQQYSREHVNKARFRLLNTPDDESSDMQRPLMLRLSVE